MSQNHNLLSIPLKSSPPLSTLTPALRNHISTSYTDTHPSAFSSDIRELQRLRDEWSSTTDVHVSATDLGIRYHAQLVWLGGKMASDIGISFPWTISFPSSLPILASLGPSISPSPPSSPSNSRSSSPNRDSNNEPKIQSRPYATTQGNKTIIAHPSLSYERANVLWGLAAMYSQLGASESRGEGESLKRAVKAFQISAGILSHIHETLLPLLASLPSPRSPDLQASMLESLRDAMLAQAMECFWQKGVVDHLKDATIAKLAMRVSELYGSSLDSAAEGGNSGNGGWGGGSWGGGAGSDGCELPSEWLNHMNFKRWHFAAASQYRKSCDDLGSNRYGDELGRLKIAELNIKRASDVSKKGVSPHIISDLESLRKVIQTNMTRASKDNDLIYLEPVTSASNLPPIPGADMVKVMLPPKIANPIPLLRLEPAPALGNPLFRELVPYGVHIAISIYDDRKDEHVRERISERLNELDVIAATTLQSLNLPGSLQALEQPMNLPPSLLNRSSEVHSSGGLSRLLSLLNDVARISSTDSQVLSEAASILAQESQEDEEVRTNFSEKRWMRESSETAAREMRQRASEYEATMKMASDSDLVVKKKLEDWQGAISVLDGGQFELEKFVPLGKNRKNGDENEAQELSVRALRSSLEDLDDLLESRASSLNEARSVAMHDDVRSNVLIEAGRIVANNSNPGEVVLQPAHFESLFEEEIKKYERFLVEVEDSENEQERLLEEIRERNDAFTEARKVDPTVRRREEALQTLDLAYAKFREITSNLEEGLKFYNSLARILHDFRQEVKEWHRARTIDIQQLTSTFAGTSLSSRPSATSPANPSPARNTRAKTRSQKTDSQPHSSQQQAQPPQQSQQAPQWGAWSGGNINFGD